MPKLKTKEEALRNLTVYITSPYILGLEPPNYPVPATVDVTLTYVAFTWEGITHQLGETAWRWLLWEHTKRHLKLN